MGLCRLFLWLTAATAMGLSEISPQTCIWGIVLTVYIIGISLFARGESKKQSESNRYSILFLFSSPMVTLIALIYWNQLDPIRIFLANITGLLIGWIAYSSILIIKEQKKGAVGNGVSRLLAGICALDATTISLYCPTLIAPTLCCLSLCVLLKRSLRQLDLKHRTFLNDIAPIHIRKNIRLECSHGFLPESLFPQKIIL